MSFYKLKPWVSKNKNFKFNLISYLKGELIRNLEGHKGDVLGLCNLDGGYLASCSRDTKICIWNADTGRLTQTLKGHTSAVFNVIRLSLGNYLASCSDDKTIKIWDLVNEICIRTLIGHTDAVYGLAIVNYGYLASCSQDRSIKVWDIEID